MVRQEFYYNWSLQFSPELWSQLYFDLAPAESCSSLSRYVLITGLAHDSQYIFKFIVKLFLLLIWKWSESFIFKCNCYFCSFSSIKRITFIWLDRDGRATVHSIITRKVTITGFDLKSFKQCMQKWNAAISGKAKTGLTLFWLIDWLIDWFKILSAMNEQCTEMGPERCMPVYYEQLGRLNLSSYVQL